MQAPAPTRASNIPRSPEELLVSSLRFELEQDGTDASGFFDALAGAIRMRAWERTGAGTFVGFLSMDPPEGIGASAETVKTLLRLRHRQEETDPKKRAEMAWLRERVNDLLNPPVGPRRSNQHTGAVDISTAQPKTKGGTSWDQVVRRLKRDGFGDLAAAVIAGEITAAEAARRAGYRSKTCTVRTDDPDKVAAVLARHFDERDIGQICSLALELRREADAAAAR